MTRLLFFEPLRAGGFAASMRFALHLLWSFFATLDHSEASIKTIRVMKLESIIVYWLCSSSYRRPIARD